MKLEFEKLLTQVDVFSIEQVNIGQINIGQLKTEQINTEQTVQAFDPKSGGSHNIAFDHYDAVGMACPVHSFNAPKIVIDFARRLPNAESKDAFLISSAGEQSSLNNASSDLLIKILAKKGYNVFCDLQFAMPCNFIIKDDESNVRCKINQVNADIPKAVDNVINRITNLRKSSIGVKTLTFFGRAEWYGVRCFKYFYAGNNCNNCGICVSRCPGRNIEQGKTRAVFKWNCGLCMRCIYLCPNQAIRIHKPFKFIGFDSWYKDDELSLLKFVYTEQTDNISNISKMT
jgi:ferredoxin